MTTEAATRRPCTTALATLCLAFAVQAAPAPVKPVARDWALPAREGMQPDLAAAPDGSLLMSWVEGPEDARSLRFARFDGVRWSTPATVARKDWFGNALDTPQIEQTADGTLWAAWLRKSPAGGHARDVVLARSIDGGRHWAAPVPVNTDATATEHGFVSLWRQGAHSIGVVWLDGRAKAAHGDTHGAGHDHASGDDGAMQMLRSVVFDRNLHRSDEALIDDTACDCCHTDIAHAAGGPVLVYRDRTAAEVRDIGYARLQGSRWKPAGRVHSDNWTMPACPVNGPSVAAQGAHVASAWYTAAGGTPSVRYATGNHAAGGFNAGGVLDRSDAVLGRADTAADAHGAWFGWLREKAGQQSLWMASMAWNAKSPTAPFEVARLQGRGHGTGMFRMAAAPGRVYVLWSDVIDGRNRLVGRTLATR